MTNLRALRTSWKEAAKVADGLARELDCEDHAVKTIITPTPTGWRVVVTRYSDAVSRVAIVPENDPVDAGENTRERGSASVGD